MDEANRFALLKRVRKTQHLCRVLRAAIMVAVRHCEFTRWVPFEEEDGSINWERRRLSLGKSLQTPFKGDLSDGRLFWERVQAITTVKTVLAEEQHAFPDDAPESALQEASAQLATILSALRIILIHAQEYGVCWRWLKTVDGPGGTETFTASELREVLVEPLVGHPTEAQFTLRSQAATWLGTACVAYIGDLYQPASQPAADG